MPTCQCRQPPTVDTRLIMYVSVIEGAVVMKQPVIHSDPDIQGGVPVFVGTRVPVKNLFDY